jgi:hypothetical protein
MRDKRGLFTGLILAVAAAVLVLLTRSAGAQDPKTPPAVRSGDAVAAEPTGPSRVPKDHPDRVARVKMRRRGDLVTFLRVL